MKLRSLTWLVCVGVLVGCAGEDAAANSSEAPYRPVASVQELMLAVVEPAAETYWDAVGWITDSSGTLEIRPSTEEEWEAVRNAAYVVTESGNLLMMEGRAVDDQTWIALSQAMIATGQRAIDAANARDPEAVFTVGGDLYETCTACHSAYALGTLRPNFGED